MYGVLEFLKNLSKLPNLEKNTPSSSPWHWIYLCTSLIITVLVYREIWELQAILQLQGLYYLTSISLVFSMMLMYSYRTQSIFSFSISSKRSSFSCSEGSTNLLLPCCVLVDSFVRISTNDAQVQTRFFPFSGNQSHFII